MKKIKLNGEVGYLISTSGMHQKLQDKIPALKGKRITNVDGSATTASIHYLENNQITEGKIEDHKIFFVQKEPTTHIITSMNLILEMLNIDEQMSYISKKFLKNEKTLCMVDREFVNDNRMYYFITIIDEYCCDTFIEIKSDMESVK